MFTGVGAGSVAFQSLIGRLKTVATLTRLIADLRFQSLIGRLKTIPRCQVLFAAGGFNPS